MKSIKLSCCALGVAALLLSSGAFAAGGQFTCVGSVNLSDWQDAKGSANTVLVNQGGSSVSVGSVNGGGSGSLGINCTSYKVSPAISGANSITIGTYTLDLTNIQMPANCANAGHIYFNYGPMNNSAGFTLNDKVYIGGCY